MPSDAWTLHMDWLGYWYWTKGISISRSFPNKARALKWMEANREKIMPLIRDSDETRTYSEGQC